MSECLLPITAALHRPYLRNSLWQGGCVNRSMPNLLGEDLNVSAHSPGENITEALKGPLTGVLASFLYGVSAVNLALERN